MKLNIGDNNQEYDGYEGVDLKRGQSAMSLSYASESIDEVRASHVLEHISHYQILNTLREWFRVLAPGGVMKIAVPDFKSIAKRYLAGEHIETQLYVMGAQVDKTDFHASIFDEEVLSAAMRQVGLIGIRNWRDEIDDCSSLPISLNLAGTKPLDKWPSVAAVISVPRLGFNDFWACAYKELSPLMPLRKVTGAYWDRDLTMAIEESIEAYNPEWILTADYDTVFNRDQVLSLLELAGRSPEADAIAPIQVARHNEMPMLTVREDEKLVSAISREQLTKGEKLKCHTAHFGLTLLRVSKLKAMPRPWFERTYGPSACDPDVNFWHKWHAAGNTLYTALRVPVGHCDLVVRWPDENLETIYQTPQDFFKNGVPERIWK